MVKKCFYFNTRTCSGIEHNMSGEAMGEILGEVGKCENGKNSARLRGLSKFLFSAKSHCNLKSFKISCNKNCQETEESLHLYIQSKIIKIAAKRALGEEECKSKKGFFYLFSLTGNYVSPQDLPVEHH